MIPISNVSMRTGKVRIVWQYPSGDLCVRTEPFDWQTSSVSLYDFVVTMYTQNVALDSTLKEANVIATEHEFLDKSGIFHKDKLPYRPTT